MGPHGRRTDVSDLAGPDNVVECFHGLFDWCVRIETVDLQQIHVREVKAFETGVDALENVLSAQAILFELHPNP
jgi:hypothetical protein